jgi:hypothetical protein
LTPSAVLSLPYLPVGTYCRLRVASLRGHYATVNYSSRPTRTMCTPSHRPARTELGGPVSQRTRASLMTEPPSARQPSRFLNYCNLQTGRHALAQDIQISKRVMNGHPKNNPSHFPPPPPATVRCGRNLKRVRLLNNERNASAISWVR